MGNETNPELPNVPNRNARRIVTWFWLLLILVVGFLLYVNQPKAEVEISYSPGFLDELEACNLATLTVSGDEAYGEFRSSVPFRPAGSTVQRQVTRYSTRLPAGVSVDALVERLREADCPTRVRIESPRVQWDRLAVLLLLQVVFAEAVVIVVLAGWLHGMKQQLLKATSGQRVEDV